MAKRPAKKSDKQLNIMRFLYQTGWLDAAGKELLSFETDFPALKTEGKPCDALALLSSRRLDGQVCNRRGCGP